MIAAGSAIGGTGNNTFVATGSGSVEFGFAAGSAAERMTFGASFGTLYAYSTNDAIGVNFQTCSYAANSGNGTFGMNWAMDRIPDQFILSGIGGSWAIAAPGQKLIAASGWEVLHASISGNTLEGDGLGSYLYGSDGNDTLIGSRFGSTTFDGGGGTNVMTSLRGASTNGGDTFLFDSPFTTDTINGFGRYDILDFHGDSMADLNISISGGSTTITSVGHNFGTVVLNGFYSYAPITNMISFA